MNEEDKFHRRNIRIKQLIREQPGITATELSKATASIGEFERQDILELLIEDEKIREEVVKGRGRPTRRYWPVYPAEASAKPATAARRADDPDPATMTVEQIEAFNDERRTANAIVAQIGWPPLPLLPLPS
jgi:hypothetical protein